MPQVAAREHVPADALANYMAFRLSLQRINWWGAATNLQEAGRIPGRQRETFSSNKLILAVLMMLTVLCYCKRCLTWRIDDLVVVAQGIQNTLKPLKITCTSVDCEHGLHCFRQTQRLASGTQAGHCRACGVALIDWSRVYQRDPADASYTFAALKYELIRHYF